MRQLENNYLVEAIDHSLQQEVDSIPESDKKEKAVEPSSEPLSFSDWINDRRPEASAVVNELIERFIQEEPRISKPEAKEFYSPVEKGKLSLDEEGLPYSETLARIFEEQGNSSLAIKAYRHLMLKNPQKSVYFADLIKKLEEKK